MDAGGQLTAVADFPQAEAIGAVQDAHFSTDDDYDDLYGDFDFDSGFIPIPPPSPSPTSPPKTPSPGLSVASPPPRRTRTPKPQAELEAETDREPQPNPATQHQPPLPMPKPPTPRHQPQQSPLGCSTSSPPTTALYIAELPWWTTDAEVETALAPHGALHSLHFFTDKFNGKSRGFCRANFLHPAASATAAAALHGRTFHGRQCVASLSCPPGLHRPGADFDASALAPAPKPTLGRGGNASNVVTTQGNVGLLGGGPLLMPLPRPMAPWPRAFGAMMVSGGGFPSVGQSNVGMGTDTNMMPPVMAAHGNPAFLAANRMAMCSTGVWHDQRTAGGLWSGQQPWNFGGCEMPWQQLSLQNHRRQSQQQYRNGDYGKTGGIGRERSGGRNKERDIGNVRSNHDRRQCGRGGGERRPREHNRGGRDQYREYSVLDKKRERERNCDDRDRHGGEKRRHQEHTERDDQERRGRARSQSWDSDDDDHPRRRR